MSTDAKKPTTTAPRQRATKKDTTPAVTLDTTELKKPTANYHVIGLPGVDGRVLPAYLRKDDVKAATDPTTGIATFVIRFKPTA